MWALVRSFRLRPVAWYVSIMTVVSAAMGAAEISGLIPRPWWPWLQAAVALAAILGGRTVHGAVTPLALPRDEQLRPLVTPSAAGREPRTGEAPRLRGPRPDLPDWGSR